LSSLNNKDVEKISRRHEAAYEEAITSPAAAGTPTTTATTSKGQDLSNLKKSTVTNKKNHNHIFPLSGNKVFFDLSQHEKSFVSAPNNKAITSYDTSNNEIPYISGSSKLVFFNENRFYGYRLLKGPLRAFHRPSSARTILKGHSANVVDVKLMKSTKNTLASVALDGSLIVWNLVIPTDTQKKELDYEVILYLLQEQPSTTTSSTTTKAATTSDVDVTQGEDGQQGAASAAAGGLYFKMVEWHPNKGKYLVVVRSDESILLLDLNILGEEARKHDQVALLKAPITSNSSKKLPQKQQQQQNGVLVLKPCWTMLMGHPDSSSSSSNYRQEADDDNSKMEVVTSISFSRDSKLFGYTTLDGSVTLLETATYKLVNKFLAIPNGPATSLYFCGPSPCSSNTPEDSELYNYMIVGGANNATFHLIKRNFQQDIELVQKVTLQRDESQAEGQYHCELEPNSKFLIVADLTTSNLMLLHLHRSPAAISVANTEENDDNDENSNKDIKQQPEYRFDSIAGFSVGPASSKTKGIISFMAAYNAPQQDTTTSEKSKASKLSTTENFEEGLISIFAILPKTVNSIDIPVKDCLLTDTMHRPTSSMISSSGRNYSKQTEVNNLETNDEGGINNVGAMMSNNINRKSATVGGGGGGGGAQSPLKDLSISTTPQQLASTSTVKKAPYSLTVSTSPSTTGANNNTMVKSPQQSPSVSGGITTTFKQQQQQQQTEPSSIIEDSAEPLLSTSESRLLHKIEQLIEKKTEQSLQRFFQKFEADRKDRLKQEKKKQEELLTVISKTLCEDIPAQFEEYVVNAIIPPLKETVTNLLLQQTEKSFQNLNVDYQNRIEKSIDKNLDPALVTEKLLGHLKQPIKESFNTSLKTTVIPQFEQYCGRMFSQISHTFENGVEEKIISPLKDFYSQVNKQTVLALEDQLKVFSENFSGQQVEEKAGSSLSSSATNNTGRRSAGGKKAVVNVYEEIGLLIGQSKFDEAFSRGLRQNDLRVVEHLLKNLDSGILENVELYRISQPVILSLMQQISCDLKSEPLLKIDWLQKASLALNPQDPLIAPHCSQILEVLLKNISRVLQEGQLDRNIQTKLKLVLHVINSLYKEIK